MKVGDLEVLPVSDGRLLAPWPDTCPKGHRALLLGDVVHCPLERRGWQIAS